MKATQIALVVILTLALSWEVWTLANGVAGDTLSEAVWEASRRPLVPFLAGFLMGHWFWQKGKK